MTSQPDPFRHGLSLFRKNDRVKLSDRFAKAIAGKSKPRSKFAELWFTREGIVVRANALVVTVKWDDRKTYDYFPPKALQKVSATAAP